MEVEPPPQDRDILAYNGFVGPYRTHYTDGQWPLYGLDGRPDWCHYPGPTHWMELTELGNPSIPILPGNTVEVEVRCES